MLGLQTLKGMVAIGITVKCENCGKEFECYPKRYYTSKHHCCSRECSTALMKKLREQDENYLNCTCVVCGKKFHVKKSHLERYPTHTCSPECTKEQQRRRMTGENNHQYGLRGEKNASWKGGRKISSYGYVLIYDPEHPFCNGDGNVFEHRLVAEKYLLNDENSVIINGIRYLSPDYAVHHKDFNRQNNDVSNLEVMTKGEHVTLHNLTNPRERDELGRFIAD